MKREEAIKAIEDNRPRSGYIILNEALDMAITALQNQPVWIPVSERLPEDGTYITTLDGELVGQEEPFTSICGIEDGKWDEDECVIAWQPLPQPYQPKGE